MPLTTSDLEFSDDYPTIEPSIKLNFANARALDARTKFWRNSIATYVDRNGVIKTVGKHVARFDHDPATGESLGLLIEEQKTNEIINSQDLSFWDGAFSSSVEVVQTDTAIAPDGTQTADSMLGDGGSGRYTIRFSQTLATSTQFTFSVFVKKIQGVRYCALETASYTTWSDTGIVVFDLDTGTLLSNTIQGGGIEQYANGWYRIYGVSTTSTNGGNSGFYINFTLSDGSSTLNPGPATNEGLYVWGAQLEQGSFPTSYIPTNGATVTREEEEPMIDPREDDGDPNPYAVNNVDYYNAEEGTHLIEFRGGRLQDGDADATILSYVTDGIDRQLIFSGTVSGGSSAPSETSIGYHDVTSLNGSNHTTSFKTAAFAYGGTTMSLSSNGNVVNGTWDRPQFNNTDSRQVLIGHLNLLYRGINGHVKKYHYYPKRLTDAQLQLLTQ